MPIPVPEPDPGPGPVVGALVGAGDISTCENNNDEATARLLDRVDGTIFTVGDNVYESGTARQFRDCYDPTWGRHLARTRPSPGNHEYQHRGRVGLLRILRIERRRRWCGLLQLRRGRLARPVAEQQRSGLGGNAPVPVGPRRSRREQDGVCAWPTGTIPSSVPGSTATTRRCDRSCAFCTSAASRWSSTVTITTTSDSVFRIRTVGPILTAAFVSSSWGLAARASIPFVRIQPNSEVRGDTGSFGVLKLTLRRAWL